jgi:outer membrane receptor protein involved in Fe transport
VAIAAFGAYAPALADDDDDDNAQRERIVVTGSRIQRQDFTANAPIVTIDQDTFENTSTIGIETILNQLPQFIPGVVATDPSVAAPVNGAGQFSTGGSQFASGGIEASSFQTPGASSVNLRGLGAGRNLILVDGRRAMPINSSMTVDTNSIPSSAIQRVEIISGGASAVYGADAVAGAINFILKDDFEGLTVDSNYGITELGDAQEFRLSTLFGANTPDGRGNVMIGLEHSTRGGGDFNDRDWYVDDRANPNVGGSDFFFSDTYVQLGTDLRFAGFPSALRTAVEGIFDELPPGVVLGTDGPSFIPGFDQYAPPDIYINRSPTLDGATVYAGGGGLFGVAASAAPGAYRYEGPLDVNGFPFRKIQPHGGIAQNQTDNPISVPLERYSLFGRGRYDITDNVSAFTNATFARTSTTTSSQFSPAVFPWNVNIPHGSEVWADSIGAAAGLLPGENLPGVDPLIFDFVADPAITAYDPVTGAPTFNAGDIAQDFRGRGAILGTNPVTGQPIFNPFGLTNPGFVDGGAFGLGCGPVGGCTETEVFPMPPEVVALLAARPLGFGVAPGTANAGPNASVPLGRVMDYLGERSTENTTTNYQFLVGLEGTLPNSWSWDASVSHGEAEVTTRLINFASLERYRAIILSPNFGRNAIITGNEPAGGFGAGRATCTSGLPVFVDFEVSEDCVNAIRANLEQSGRMEQNVFEANVTGDLFEVPAGTVQFALGTTYRENDYTFTTADINRSENFLDVSLGLFPVGQTSGRIDVTELYGELLVPIVSDGPQGLRALNLELGGRYSDYNVSGGVETYKALADWLVLDWLRFRGGYNRATRAPNIQELFTGRTLSIFGSSGSQGDVCSENNYQSTLSAATGTRASDGAVAPATAQQAAQTRAICESLMGEAGTIEYYSRAVADQPMDAGFFGGSAGSLYISGNTNVQPETADTLTAGFVVTSPLDSPWLQGFSGSVDWFRIEVEDVISQDLGDTVQTRCFSVAENTSGDPNNVWCQRLARNPEDGESYSLDVGYSNEAIVELEGVDIQVNWNSQFEDVGLGMIPGGVGVNLLATIPLTVQTQGTSTSPVLDWVGHQAGSGCPAGISCSAYDYQLFTTFNYFVGPWNASLRWQHYPSIDSGAKVTNPLSTALGVHKSYDVFALSGGYRINDNLLLRAGVENLLDQVPPISGGNPNGVPFPSPPTRTTGGTYDPFGRRYFVGLNATF